MSDMGYVLASDEAGVVEDGVGEAGVDEAGVGDGAGGAAAFDTVTTTVGER